MADVHTIYNEIEPYAAEWLQNLIAQGSIADGRVDTRSIADLLPADVAGAGQRHFFAGIGVWSLALRLAGWPDDLDVWTGSCPCQPFSQAGRGRGFADDRHLWPEWFRLVEECRPAVVLGEQVASKDGLAWFDAVRADLEGAGYAVGAADLCAAGVGAPHIRQRLYFCAVADDDDARRRVIRQRLARVRDGWAQPRDDAHGRSAPGDGLGNSNSSRTGRDPGAGDGDDTRREGRRVFSGDERDQRAARCGSADGRRLPDTESERRRAGRDAGTLVGQVKSGRRDPWDPCEWVLCDDPRYGVVRRPVEPGTFPLAHGSASRVVDGGAVEIQPRTKTLRGYGNAIVAEVAATWIDCVIDALIET